MNGVKNIDSISIDTAKKIITLNADNLTGKLLFGSKRRQSSFSYSLTYKSAGNTEGYSLSTDKKSISYTPAVVESDLFSLSNVKNTHSISVNTTKKTVTLNANNLTGDYSLKLANDIPTSATKTAGSFTKFKSATATFNLLS